MGLMGPGKNNSTSTSDQAGKNMARAGKAAGRGQRTIRPPAPTKPRQV